MAVFKCKMCGANIDVLNTQGICTCEYCNTTQTVSTRNDDDCASKLNRANFLRLKNDFDKAQALFEQIVAENNDEAEAYWGIVLCKYGVEYVDDKASGTRIPTCHRTEVESVLSDGDYLNAVKCANDAQKTIYNLEAKRIDTIQSNILKIVRSESPYDVFICYKETDESGNRTKESVIANDIYYQLTKEGYKVFYAAITLESKLGQEYEPYIYAALTSSKVMLVVTTSPNYVNAPWVKNEWNRFLKMMKKDSNKLLIPCYKNMDAYELPDEFSHFQALNMEKIGFMTDLLNGIRKVLLKKDSSTGGRTTIVQQGNINIDNALKRGFMSLEDGDYTEANRFFENALNQDPELAIAYLGKAMIELKVNERKAEKFAEKDIRSAKSYKNIRRYADTALGSEVDSYIASFEENQEKRRIAQEEAERLRQEELERQAELKRQKELEQRERDREEHLRIKKARQKRRRIIFIVLAIILVGAIAGVSIYTVAYNNSFYVEKYDIGDFPEAGGGYNNEKYNATASEYHKVLNEMDPNYFKAEKHDFTITIEKDVSCTEDGLIRYKCKICNEIIDKPDPATGHNYGSTYQTDRFGYTATIRECSVCGAIEYEPQITFGTYQGEKIDWTMLTIIDGYGLLLSDKILDCKAFDSTGNNKYEDSEIRQWLNNEFYNAAFTDEEKALVTETLVDNDITSSGDSNNPDYSRTAEHVFLLSYAEVMRFFPGQNDKLATSTSYAKTQGLSTYSGGYADWWLRSSSASQAYKQAQCVWNNGKVDGLYVKTAYGVRPALWIKL